MNTTGRPVASAEKYAALVPVAMNGPRLTAVAPGDDAPAGVGAVTGGMGCADAGAGAWAATDAPDTHIANIVTIDVNTAFISVLLKSSRQGSPPRLAWALEYDHADNSLKGFARLRASHSRAHAVAPNSGTGDISLWLPPSSTSRGRLPRRPPGTARNRPPEPC